MVCLGMYVGNTDDVERKRDAAAKKGRIGPSAMMPSHPSSSLDHRLSPVHATAGMSPVLFGDASMSSNGSSSSSSSRSSSSSIYSDDGQGMFTHVQAGPMLKCCQHGGLSMAGRARVVGHEMSMMDGVDGGDVLMSRRSVAGSGPATAGVVAQGCPGAAPAVGSATLVSGASSPYSAVHAASRQPGWARNASVAAGPGGAQVPQTGTTAQCSAAAAKSPANQPLHQLHHRRLLFAQHAQAAGVASTSASSPSATPLCSISALQASQQLDSPHAVCNLRQQLLQSSPNTFFHQGLALPDAALLPSSRVNRTPTPSTTCAPNNLQSIIFNSTQPIDHCSKPPHLGHLSPSLASLRSTHPDCSSGLIIPATEASLFSNFALGPAYQHTVCSIEPPAQHTLSMAASFNASEEEMARMQELSNTWEADSEGPLLSERIPTTNLTTEYANADPFYVVKTQALPQKFSYYRKCRGDGHCGWRAVTFCYYEILLRLGNRQKFLEEDVRLKSLSNLIKESGFDEMLYEDFVEDTLTLLRETSRATDGGAALVEAFNDYNRSQSIITCIKLLTSAWMNKHQDKYAPYLEMPVKEYCKNRIDPVNSEIENVGLSALFDLLLSPAGIGITVQYLDRSPGSETTTYSWEPLDHNGMPITNAPSLTLLYRPGHYDILYRPEDLPVVTPAPATAGSEVTVAFNHGQTEHYYSRLPFPVNDFEIPGMDVFPSSSSGAMWQTFPAQNDLTQSSFIMGGISRPAVEATPYQGLTSGAMHQNYLGASAMSMESRHSISPSTTGPVVPNSPSTPVGNLFRPSKWEYQQNYASLNNTNGFCQTAIFKNSHFNPAHFNNPDFEPEQWQPESEYNTGEKSRKKSGAS